MRKKLLGILGPVLLLTACESGPSQKNVNVGSSVTPGTSEDFRTNVKDRIFFDFNKCNITPEAQKVLESQASWLKTYPNTLATVEGHCDERGTREYNLALGKRRAEAVKKNLGNVGISKKRIKTISYGKDKPSVIGTGEEVWQKNRTAITIIN